MTRFIDVATLTRIVSRIGIRTFLQQLTDEVTENFRRWNDFEKSARLASHSDIGVIELMPVVDQRLYGFKYVNGHPANTRRGLSTVMAFGALAEVETGYPLLLSELTLSTALRTAATSVMAAKALARPDSRRMAIIGCGAQSEFQAIAFHQQLGIRELQIHDIDHHAMLKLQANLTPFPDLKVSACDSSREAVHGCDIVTTITADKSWATIIEADMVAPGMHLNALGGDCPGKTELDAEVLRRGRVFVEYEPQTRIEGDIQQLPAAFPVTELWQVLTGNEPGRSSAQQVTVFDSVGFALEDFSLLNYLYRLSQQLDIGDNIDLIPELADPKDLYAALQGPAGGMAIRSTRSHAA